MPFAFKCEAIWCGKGLDTPGAIVVGPKDPMRPPDKDQRKVHICANCAPKIRTRFEGLGEETELHITQCASFLSVPAGSFINVFCVNDRHWPRIQSWFCEELPDPAA